MLRVIFLHFTAWPGYSVYPCAQLFRADFSDSTWTKKTYAHARTSSIVEMRRIKRYYIWLAFEAR